MLKAFCASLALLLMASLSASADNFYLGTGTGTSLIGVTGWDGTPAPIVPCATSLVFDQSVACNAVAWSLMGK